MTSSGAASHGYQTWGAYGSSKAAMNHLAMTISAEEPVSYNAYLSFLPKSPFTNPPLQEITALAIRPGVVATEMQREIREVHKDSMGEENKKFQELHQTGQLLKPEQPGHVIAKLSLEAPKEFNGQFLSWNSPELKAFQE